GGACRGAFHRPRAAPRTELALRRGLDMGGCASRHLISGSLLSTRMQGRFDAYADLIVRVGANLQHGQTFFVNGLPQHLELVRVLGRSAYRAGASYVDVRYTDPHVRRAQIELGPEDALTHSPDWLVERAAGLEGNAVVSIAGEAEPELLADLDQERVGKSRMIAVVERMLEIQNKRAVNWTIAAFPNEGWAEKV